MLQAQQAAGNVPFINHTLSAEALAKADSKVRIKKRYASLFYF
jgi:hypothetical protein